MISIIYLLDADQNGDDSIRHLVERKLIEYLPIPSFQEFQRQVQRLIPLVGPDDTVIVDTIGSLQETTIIDARLGVDVNADFWEMRGKYLGGDKNYLTVYNLAGDTIIRRMKNIRARGAKVVTTSHESEMTDPTDLRKKRAPKLSPAMYESIMRNTSDVVRLSEVIEPILDNDGNIKLPTGTRLLQLRKTEEAVAKYHVVPKMSARIALYLTIPPVGGIHKYHAHVGKRPAWLHIYGPPGVGKTSLCGSEAETLTPAVPVVLNTQQSKEVAS